MAQDNPATRTDQVNRGTRESSSPPSTSLPPLSTSQPLPTRGSDASAAPPAKTSAESAGHPPALRSEGGGNGGAVAAPSGATASPPPRKKSAAKKLIPLGIAAALAIGAGFQGYEWWTVGRFHVSTDDAYVKADTTIVAAKVSGYVSAVPVAENHWVKAGDVLATIDDGDLRLAVQEAKDRLSTQDATLDRLRLEATSSSSTISEKEAKVQAAEAALDRANREFDRQSKLVHSGVAADRSLDDARADRNEAMADLDASWAQLATATSDQAVLKARVTEAEGQRAELATALDQAERNLTFATIRAPIDGVVGNRAVEVGQYITPGQRLAALVPLEAVYVDANFKETQLAALQPGQPVDIAIDAYPDTTFHGHVDSLSPASGAEFSLLPPQNATGNFTKIVQRMPVRVAFDTPQSAAKSGTMPPIPRPGMSVVVTVNTKGSPPTQKGAQVAESNP
ncbi:HlyD family secretion protein [Rhodospirillum sp. A1_3_36]|uniref:HlyD family secretion protein n=1 Tax=Rhodospirillum sp. A1_3_36 TaxID=3391666 RepID=UPI0039A5DA18